MINSIIDHGASIQMVKKDKLKIKHAVDSYFS